MLACKRDPVPKDAIPREKFVDILVDVHIAESIFRDRVRINMDSIQSTQLYKLVLEKYDVTDDEMLLTSVYYSRNQKEYDKIYGEVLSKISMMIEEDNEKNELNLNSPEPTNMSQESKK